MEDELLDDFAESESLEAKLRIEKKRLWYAIATGILLNAAILGLLRGSENWFFGFLRSLMGASLSSLILGFGLGLLIALIPFRDLSYSQKYLRASQWSSVVVSGMMTIALLSALGSLG